MWVCESVLETFKEGELVCCLLNLGGQFCATPADSLKRWKQHFNTV